jgi:hypothetical protein
MISGFWFIGDKADFYTSRSGRIGSSDTPALFVNPEKPSESLAGFGRTALTVYQEKRGEIEREPAGLHAEIGHFDENKTLELAIRPIIGYEKALLFRIQKERFEADCAIARINKKPLPSARGYQLNSCPFLHSVEYFDDDVVVHPDCIYVGNESLKGKKDRWFKNNGIKIDLSKPFIIEAKSAMKYAAKRPEGSNVKGYDFSLSGWQGIPLKHHVQTQFQGMIFRIDTVILALLYDTSSFSMWKTGPDKKIRGAIADRVGRMVRHIKDGTMPRELAMNTDDVMAMIPDIQRDYIMLSGEKLEMAKEAAITAMEAKEQKERWTAKEKDAKDALAVILDEFEEIRDGSEKIAVWQFRKGSEGFQKPDMKSKVSFLNQLKKNDPITYNYLKKKGYIKVSDPTRYVSVKYRAGEDE